MAMQVDVPMSGELAHRMVRVLLEAIPTWGRIYREVTEPQKRISLNPD